MLRRYFSQVVPNATPSSSPITTNTNKLIEAFRQKIPAFVRDFKTGIPLEQTELSPLVFGAPVRPDIIHRNVVWYLAGQRQGTACVKSRGEVRGSRRKIRQQKGSGKARVGTIRAPHRRGGGVAFGPKPRDYSFHLSKKIQEFGLRSALTAKYKQAELFIVDYNSLNLEKPKTKLMAKIMEQNNYGKLLLVDVKKLEHNLDCASRNLQQFDFKKAQDITVYDLMKKPTLLITQRAVQYFEKKLAQK